jgi:uncharacterized protein YndB with AHSA1/START domain
MPDPGPPGTVRPAPGGRLVVRFEQVYARPPADVWQAITDTGSLGRWSCPLTDYGASRLDFAEGAGLLFVAKDRHLLPDLLGQVTRAEPPRLLEYTMASQVLRWQLTADGGSACQLVLTITAGLRASLEASTPYWEAALDALADELG